VLLAVALAVAIAGRGCGADDDSPVGAVRAFISAARAGDSDAIYSLLGPRTRAYLEDSARTATDYAGGSRRFAHTELLRVSDAGSDRRPPRDVLLRDRDGDRAIVDVVSADGVRSPIEVVNVDGGWRIELVESK
jgi:hypothetical protein